MVSFGFSLQQQLGGRGGKEGGGWTDRMEARSRLRSPPTFLLDSNERERERDAMGDEREGEDGELQLGMVGERRSNNK